MGEGSGRHQWVVGVEVEEGDSLLLPIECGKKYTLCIINTTGKKLSKCLVGIIIH